MVAHGEMDSTAEERYDFSCFFGGAEEGISSTGRSSRPGLFSRPVQTEVDSTRDAGK